MSSMFITDIPSVKLKGHQGAVLCLDHNSSAPGVMRSDSDTTTTTATTNGFLLSGSEDSTCRLWDLRQAPKSSTCIVAEGEVTSVAFGPPSGALSENSNTFSKNFTVYLSVGAEVFGYDLRKASLPVLRLADDSTTAVEKLLEAEDEINQIVLAEGGIRRDPTLFLAAADDTGIVQVLDNFDPSKTKKIPTKRVLQHCKERTSMITSCVFRPLSTKTLDLASGGTDCQVCLWDINKPKRAMFSKKITADPTGNRNQLCNPPMVHSLAWSPSGRLLAAGLGDGTSSVFLVENRSLVEVARLQADTGHESAVASVLFPSILPIDSSQQKHATSQDRLLACIRNDAVVQFWDLGCNVAGEKAINPSRILPNNGESETNPEATKVIGDAVQDLSLVADQPKLLFGIPHNKKPNWMTTSRGCDTFFPSTIFLADTTNDITAYTIPLR